MSNYDKAKSGPYKSDIALATWLEGIHVENYKFIATLTSFFSVNNVESVAVLGAGGGYIPSYLRNSGFFISCYDGSEATQEVTFGQCSVMDLSKRIDICKHDWVVSIHVGEHIKKEFEDIFLQNLDSTCRIGIILGWPEPVDLKIPEHVNECYNNYIKEKMYALEYTNNLVIEKALRESGSPRLKDSLMVFVKKDYKQNIMPVFSQNLDPTTYKFTGFHDMVIKIGHIDQETKKEIIKMPESKVKEYIKQKIITQYEMNKGEKGLKDIFELNQELNINQQVMCLEFIYDLKENSDSKDLDNFLEEIAEELYGSEINQGEFMREIQKIRALYSNTAKSELK